VKSKLPPVYYNLRIYALAVFLYLLLVFPISLIMLFKYGPHWIEEQGFMKDNEAAQATASSPAASDKPVLTLNIGQGNVTASEAKDKTASSLLIKDEDIKFGSAVAILLRLLGISMVLSLTLNYPFKRYFYRKRRHKPLSKSLVNLCRRWLVYMPVINSASIGLAFLVYLIILGTFVYGSNITSEISTHFYRQFFFISLFASVLTVLFVYFWHKHRVTFKYLDHVFDSVSLYKAGKRDTGGHIKYRLWVNSTMTTMMPLIIVVFYLFLSITSIKQATKGVPKREEVQILFGKYLPFIDQANLVGSDQLFYVNAIDSLLMFVGIFSGILISIVYLFFFVNWTTSSIVVPVSEVLKKMKQSGEGGLERLAVVRTTDELGKLAIGFNEMALRISNNIHDLRQLTEANQRFVPEEFLQILGKNSIKDVQLGDQVQRCMSVLFVDIRAFTTLSETMSPKENFNFLNNYLGYMEPVIRKHQGFIDKYIGDSIMALFSNAVEDALDAALEMHRRLTDFNGMMHQFGRKPIDIGAGIHTGNLMLGVVGGEGRMETTVISDSVNLASRLEGLTREYEVGIIISEKSLNDLKDKDLYYYRYLDDVQVKGRKEVVRIYEIAGRKGRESNKYTELSTYTRAIEAFDNARYDEACGLFEKFLAMNPGDKTASMHLTRCIQFLQHIPEARVLSETMKAEINFSKLKSLVLSYLRANLPASMHYHDVAHTVDVLKAAEHYGRKAGLSEGDFLLLQTAALLHETGTVTAIENHEQASVDYARLILPEFGFGTSQVDAVCEMIMATRFPQTPLNQLSELMCDADLDYLGRPDYFSISHKLRLEWITLNHYDASLSHWYQEQLAFLSGHRFFTQWAKDERNAGKESNLQLVRSLIKYD